MSNTSTSNDKTVGDDAKVKLIIGEIGRDTQTGIIGRGYSFDNGNTFYVTDTIYGRLYTQNDADGLWNNGLHEKVKEKVNREITNTVEPAIKQADSAVAYANEAIEKSRVNQQAIVEINSAVSDAVSDAAVARSDGLRAWNAAQSNVDLINSNYASASAAISSTRTEAIAAADEAKASASAAQADVVAVRSDVAAVQADVTATQSDVATAKSDIADTKTNLASQAKSLSSYAAQASAAGKDITTLKSQAGHFEQEMADTKGDVSQLKISASSASAALSDAAGNISSLQATANSYSAALSDTNSNVASVTATASKLETKYADAAGDISQLQTDAKGMTQTISDAQGDIAKLKIRADGFDTQFADTKGDISKLQVDASGTKQTLTNAKSDIAVLQSRADGFDTKYSNVAGDINKLQVDASGMKQTLTDAKGDISTLQATATGFKNTLTDAQGNISTLQSDVSGLKKTTSDHAGNIATLQAGAKTLTSQMSSAQGDISTLKQTASGFSSRVSGMETSLANANSKIDSMQIGGINLLKDTDKMTNINYWGLRGGQSIRATYGGKYANETGVALSDYTVQFNTSTSFIDYIPQVSFEQGTDYTISFWTTIVDSPILYLNSEDGYNHQHWGSQQTISLQASGREYSGWKQVTATFKPKVATAYLTFGVSTDVDNKVSQYWASSFKLENGNKATPWSPAPEDTDAKITANSAAIEQNKKAIALKADQTAVDKINGTVSQLQSSLSVQAGQIQEKVTSSQVTGMLTGYATQEYAQGLVTLKADEWNVNLTKLKTDVNAIKTTGGGVNLVKNTSTDITIDATSSNANNWTFATIHFTEQPKQGDLITVSAEGTLTGTGTLDEYQVVLYDEHTSYSRSTAQYLKAGKRDSVTLTLDNLGGYGDTILLIYAGKAGETQGKKNVVHHLMVEEGTVAHAWSPAPSDMATVTSVTNLSATVDGIKGTVATKADQSEVTQLSNLVQTKVSSGDFTSTTTQLKNLINQRVQVGDVISQINQEAGGNTLIQVSNGKKSLILDAGNTIVTGKAWIPVACIADLTADKIKAGTLTGSTVHLDDGNGNTIDLGGLATSYVGFHSKATNGDQTYIDRNGIHNYGATYDTKISQGKITTNLLAVNGGGLIDFRSSGSGITIDSQNIKFYNSNTVNGGIEFSGGNPIATVRDGTVGNELRVRYDRSFALTPIKDESARICASSAAMQVGFVQSGRSTPDRQTTGLWVDGDKRHVNLGVWGADSTWARVEANTHNIHMQADKAHAWLSNDNVFHIYKDGDSSSTATKLQVDGWAWVNGWVEAAGHSQHSALSTKTDIQSVDDDKMLEMVNNTDLTTFLYTSDVANGETHRHIGLIIDDVHDVAQYQTPQEFIAPNGVSRDDDNMIGALFGAVKALTKRIKTLESKVG